MACIEWTCTRASCDGQVFDNRSGIHVCPKCNAPMTFHFDEFPEWDSEPSCEAEVDRDLAELAAMQDLS